MTDQAYSSSDGLAAQLGTGPQRAFALYSDIGATNLLCSANAMARLASGAIPLGQFPKDRGPSVGLDLSCRQPPACPRRLSP
jgi:hypothetical protein